MDHLPHDPAMLVSAINFLLRNEEFDNLNQICYCFDKDRRELEDYLAKAGFLYDEKAKRFR